MSMIHNNWADSFKRMEDFNELLRRNLDSVVKLKLDIVGGNPYFHHFFVSLWACNIGFLAGYRPGWLPLEEKIHQAGVFWIFSAVGVVCIILMYIFLPETKSRDKQNEKTINN